MTDDIKSLTFERTALTEQHLRDAQRADDCPEGLEIVTDADGIHATGSLEDLRWLYDILLQFARDWRLEGEQWDADRAEEMANFIYGAIDELPEQQRPRKMADGGISSDDTERSRRRGGKLSAFPYPGGKTPYVDTIIDRFPTHHTYVEPFGGSASVLLNKDPSYAEVFNDLNGDIVHFFRTLRERREELVEWLDAVPFSREVYDEWADDFWSEGYRPDDDIERAGRFYYLRFANFNGRIGRRNGFKTGGKRNEARSFRSAVDNLEHVVARLQEVTIESQDYREVLERYDREDTLFYLDPPYVDATDRYYAEAGDEEFDHAALVEALDELDGFWICSYGELPDGLADVAETVHSFTARYSMRYADRRDEAEEHLAMSFDPETEPAFVGHRQQKLSAVADGGTGRYVDTDTNR